MKREEILGMKPGPEMNALIARHVFNLEVYMTNEEWMKAGMPHIQYWDNNLRYPAYWNDEYEQGLCIDTYSEDLPAAWEVVEKFPIVNISRVEVFVGNYHHAVEIYPSVETNEPSRVEAKTAPEAICKAALLAILPDKEEETNV